MERFLAKCRFDPITGCVNWTAGTTAGRGHSARYGAFKFEGRRWFAHRWAARYIHGLEIDGLQVDHECTNTLCQHHLAAIPPSLNRELQWLRVWVGIDPPPPPFVADPHGVPFFTPPAWLIAGITRGEYHVR